ncbi:Mbeg1-like protein [Lapidilactobacillus bayanensis]|uniref:Mbeg1-like protein n=1 Tax=Lapidilactobacillus bayanensis TaxID=2485998 RepID=UPI0013DE1736|nr:Mbeg1-like protein [Lapidilactobacillus bayanensis]
MKNIINYVEKYGQQTFAELPFNELDGTILAQLAYFDYTILEQQPSFKFVRITSQALLNQACAETWNPNANFQLIQTLQKSRRYQNLKWHNWETKTNVKAEEQFSAVTLEFAPKQYFVAFRGTTSTLVDWKEDFNMTFLETIPSQKAALHYYQRMTHLHPGRFYVGGHSKGGNLATYTAIHSQGMAQQVLKGAYSIDGPGLKTPLPLNIKAKIHKYIPEASIIGLLLEPEDNYQVVKSSGTGIKQHDPYTWQIKGQHFQLIATPNELSQFTQHTVANWLTSLDDDTKQEFLDSLYTILKNIDADQINDVHQNWTTLIKLLAPEVLNSKHETKQQWRFVTNKLLNSIIGEAKLVINEKRPHPNLKLPHDNRRKK